MSVSQDPQAHLDPREVKVMLDHKVMLDKVFLVTRDLVVRLVLRATRDQRARKEPRVTQVLAVFLEALDLPVKKELLAQLHRTVKMVPPVLRDHKGPQDPLDQLGLQVKMVPQDHPVPKVPLEMLVQLETQDPLDLRDHQETQVLRDRQHYKELPVSAMVKAPYLPRPETTFISFKQGLLESLVPWETKDPLDRLATLVPQENWELREMTAPLDQRATKELRETRAKLDQPLLVHRDLRGHLDHRDPQARPARVFKDHLDPRECLDILDPREFPESVDHPEKGDPPESKERRDPLVHPVSALLKSKLDYDLRFVSMIRFCFLAYFYFTVKISV